MSEISMREQPAWLPLLEKVEAAVTQALEEVTSRLPAAQVPGESVANLERALQAAWQRCQEVLALGDRASQRVAVVAQELEQTEEALRRWLHASQRCREKLAARAGRALG